MFKHRPNGKGMVYGPNGKGIVNSVEYTLMIYSPNGKGTVLWNIVFPSGDRHGKRQKKLRYKGYNFSQNYFYELQELHYVNKSIVTSSFRGIWSSLYFFDSFFLFTIIGNW